MQTDERIAPTEKKNRGDNVARKLKREKSRREAGKPWDIGSARRLSEIEANWLMLRETNGKTAPTSTKMSQAYGC